MNSPESTTVATLARLGAATVHEALGRRGALDSAIKPLDASSVLVGPAFTVDCRPGDNLAIHVAVTKARAGDVLVVDAKGFQEAGPWGDLLTLSAQSRGLAGLVIDGSVRDISAIVEMGFPVFSRGVCIKGTDKNQPGTVGGQIVCGGVVVRTGDMIVADADGVVAVPSDELDATIAAAERREENEAAMRLEISQGRTLVEILDLDDRVAEVGYAG